MIFATPNIPSKHYPKDSEKYRTRNEWTKINTSIEIRLNLNIRKSPYTHTYHDLNAWIEVNGQRGNSEKEGEQKEGEQKEKEEQRKRKCSHGRVQVFDPAETTVE
jgi:hypothetical protein